MCFSGSVSVQPARGTSATCRQATYDDAHEAMRLEGDPQALCVQSEGDRCDSIRVNGIFLRFGLDDGEVSRIDACGSARLLMAAGEGDSRETRRVSADTCVAHIRKGRLRRVEAIGQTEVSLDSVDGSSTSLRSRAVWMAFGEAGLDSLGLDDGGRVEHTHGKGGIGSRISGRRVLLRFVDDRVERALVFREAICEQWGDGKDGSVFLSGDTLRLGFEGGRLTRAIGQGGVSGRFVPEGQENLH